MAVQYIQARVTNPGGPSLKLSTGKKKMAKKSRRPRRKATAAKRIVIAVGRKANPRRRAGLLARGRKRLSKLGTSVKHLVFGRPAPKKRKSRSKRTANGLRGRRVGGLRKANGRKRNPLRRSRRSNPGFDIKHALISGAVLIAGTYLAQMAVPWIEKKLIELAPESIGTKDDKGNLTTLGYIELAGAAGTVVLGEYLQKKFGSKSKIDFAPATYAIATYMALRGLRNAALLSDESIKVMAGTTTFGPQLAYGSAYIQPGDSDGSLVHMNGTVRASNGHHGMGTYGMGSDVAPKGYSMLGSIFTDSQLPSPAVAPHNVMQGYGTGLI